MATTMASTRAGPRANSIGVLLYLTMLKQQTAAGIKQAAQSVTPSSSGAGGGGGGGSNPACTRARTRGRLPRRRGRWRRSSSRAWGARASGSMVRAGVLITQCLANGI